MHLCDEVALVHLLADHSSQLSRWGCDHAGDRGHHVHQAQLLRLVVALRAQAGDFRLRGVDLFLASPGHQQGQLTFRLESLRLGHDQRLPKRGEVIR